MGPKGERRRSQLLFEDSRFAIYLHEGGVGRAHDLAGKDAGEPPVVLQVCMRGALQSLGRQGTIPEEVLTRPPGGGEDADDAAAGGAATDTTEAEQVFRGDELTYVVKRKSSDLFVEFARDRPPATSSGASEAGGRGGCWYGCDAEEVEEEQEACRVQACIGAAAAASTEKSSFDGDDWFPSAATASGPPPRPPNRSPKAAPPGTPAAASTAAAPGSVAAAASRAAPGESSAEDRGARGASQPPSSPRAPPPLFLPPPPASDRGWSVVRLAAWSWTGCDLELAPEGPAAAAAAGGPEEALAAPGAGAAAPHAAPRVPVVEEGDPCLEGVGCWYLMGARAPEEPPSKDGSSGDAGTLAMPGQTDLLRISNSKVEWRITGITAKMKNSSKGSRTFSAEFEAFGIPNLGLVFYPNGNSSAKQGFCSLGLKAPHGSHLRYKLYIGGTERFTDLRHNVTESWGFVDMCKVEDELEQDEDLLRLGVEIVDDIDAHETLKATGSNKVEWVLGNMQNKLRHYRKDVALYSDEFSAGGVDKLRLKFYPAGKKEADLGWCSLYLEAPKGSELRCRLSVGKKSMSFDRLEKFGEDSIWGFLTLCKLQDELEQDQEEVRVGLEVLETKRLDGRLSEAEDAYLKTLTADRRTWLLNELDRVEKLRSNSDGSVPSRFRILQLELPDQAKAVALSKLDAMHSDVLSGESSKLKKWIDGLLSIPFGTLRKPLVSIEEGKPKVHAYLEKARRALNDAVFGHDEPKQKIVQILCQWIANPQSMSLVLGIQGPPGNGKTTLCRKGIAEALERPFVQVSLGGATDASVLEGHSYTYVGSTWGRIAGLIMEAQCMNPVIFFDELDKVSDTPRGEEIIGVLTHLTDHSQNKTFMDRYFEGIPLDLSRALFIFSFNDESRLNHVLKDRLTVIHTEGFDQTAKLKIAREYLMPELLENVGLQRGDVDIGRDELTYLCQRCGVPTEDGGVRGIKQSLESVILHLNELRMTQEMPGDEVSKADDGKAAQKADGEPRAEGEDQKADHGEPKTDLGSPEKKADGERTTSASKGTDAEKADGGVKAQPPSQQEGEQDAAAAGRQRREAGEGDQQKKKRKPIRVKLPVKLTKELIEQLVTQSKAKRDGPAMMYI